MPELPATTPALAPRAWNQVERTASYFLLVVLASVIAMRLGFADVWSLPALDFALCCIALPATLASLWFGRHSRRWRLWTVGFAAATQLVPMVVRQPILLFPLLGALVPVVILLWCLLALSKKDATSHPRGS